MNLNQVTLPTRDMATSAAFYQTLGLKLIVDSIPRYCRFECPDGDATFSLHEATDFPANSGLWVYFECDDLDARVARLQQEGIVFESEPTDQVWEWREARLKDPDGHQIILFHAGENRKYPAWRVEG